MLDDEKAVMSAYYLWQNGLIDMPTLENILNKIRVAKEPTKSYSSSLKLTSGQSNYLYLLRNQGKIDLDDDEIDKLSKSEAQEIIKNVVNPQQVNANSSAEQPKVSPVVANNRANPKAEEQDYPEELKDLMKKSEVDY